MTIYDSEKTEGCNLCPRACGADRMRGQVGFCGASADMYIARAALHFWEEPSISGKEGSGAVFFSGCSLGCVYCQNAKISKPGKQKSDTHSRRLPGEKVSVPELADIFLRLQDEERANNINLVTAGHYLPWAAMALERAKENGLHIPVIYNTSGYERVEALRRLEGLVDVYLPDLKYLTPALAAQYSHAPDYPQTACAAIAEMVRQAGGPSFDEKGILQRGVIVRHLLLPGHVAEAKRVVHYLYETYGDSIYISLMNQYTPMPDMRDDPLLGRGVTKREYERLIAYAIEIGVTQAFIQEGETAKESFIPAFCEE